MREGSAGRTAPSSAPPALPPPTRGGVAQSHRATRGDGALRIRTMPQRSAQRGALSGPRGNGRSTQRKGWRRFGHRTELSDGTGTGRDGTGRSAVWPASANTCGCGPAGIGAAVATESAALQRVLRLWIAVVCELAASHGTRCPAGWPAAAAVCCTARTTPVSHWAGLQQWCCAAAS